MRGPQFYHEISSVRPNLPILGPLLLLYLAPLTVITNCIPLLSIHHPTRAHKFDIHFSELSVVCTNGVGTVAKTSNFALIQVITYSLNYLVHGRLQPLLKMMVPYGLIVLKLKAKYCTIPHTTQPPLYDQNER